MSFQSAELRSSTDDLRREGQHFETVELPAAIASAAENVKANLDVVNRLKEKMAAEEENGRKLREQKRKNENEQRKWVSKICPFRSHIFD